jgi:hypothetical protein
MCDHNDPFPFGNAGETNDGEDRLILPASLKNSRIVFGDVITSRLQLLLLALNRLFLGGVTALRRAECGVRSPRNEPAIYDIPRQVPFLVSTAFRELLRVDDERDSVEEK